MNYDFDSHKRLSPNDTHLISYQDHPKSTVAHIKIIQNRLISLLLQMRPICLISGVFFLVDLIKDLYFFFLFTVIYSRPCQLVQTKRQRFNCGHARTEASDAFSTFEPKMSRNETLVIQDRFRAFRFSLTLSSVECASLVYLLLTLTVQFRYSYKKISKFPWFKREFKFQKNLKVFFRTSVALEIVFTTLDSYKNTGTSVIITSFIFLLQLLQKITEKLWF